VRRRRAPFRPAGRTLPSLFLAFFLGGVTGWWIHLTMSARQPAVLPAAGPSLAPEPAAAARVLREPVDPETPGAAATSGESQSDAVVEVRRHTLRLPIDGANASSMEGGFAEPRQGEPRGHEAVDMLAPRNTPVRAVEDGKIAKLFLSKAGGNTIYQFDPSERFCYYYAHLDHYAEGLHEGQPVKKGEVIGYVGTTGNAPANSPHLHFAILKLGDDKRWWKGTAIDPFLVFRP
jgi:murein DD-endopeptidase MepM/ murein hydrolase activator NlpD